MGLLPSHFKTIHARLRMRDYANVRNECSVRRLSLGAFFTRAAENLLCDDVELERLERDVSRAKTTVRTDRSGRRFVPAGGEPEEERVS